jgi:cell division protein FtsL
MGVSAMLSFDRAVAVETVIVVVSPGVVVSVESAMPIPAAMNAPSPPAMEELLKVGSRSMLTWVEESISPLETSISDNLHAVVLLLVVLLSAVPGVAMRHRTRTRRRPVDIEKKDIIQENIMINYQRGTLPSSSFGSEAIHYMASQAVAGENMHSRIQLEDHAVKPLSWSTCACYSVPTYS